MDLLPSRARLAALTEAITGIVPPVSLGFSRAGTAGETTVLYWHPNGVGRYAVPAADVPAVFAPTGGDVRELDVAALGGARENAFAWLMHIGGAHRVASWPVRGADWPFRFWAALPSDTPLGVSERTRVSELTETIRDAWRPDAPDDVSEWRARLELAADLLPSLLQVLDVRDVFERLSMTARQALPHDLLLLRLFSDDMTRITIHARSDRGTNVATDVPNPYPPQVNRAWDFDITDDLRLHPLEREHPPVKLGARAALRLPIRFNERVIGGLGFLSFTPGRYTTADVAIARRLADHVAVGVSHHQQAARLADQARRTEELRARTRSIELVDAVLNTVSEGADTGETLARLSALSRKVVLHDAAAVAVWRWRGRGPHIHTTGPLAKATSALEHAADELAASGPWSAVIRNHSDVTGTSETEFRSLGFASSLCAPVLLDGRVAGALWLVASAADAFSEDDLLVVHRLTDRLATSIARERESAATKRADEATARAAALEARVRALTEELDARTGFRRVVGESSSWRQVLKQAAQVAATETTVLLLGESGTGKEVVARFIHRASQRKNGPFVALNCAALPEQLLEAELFGYERGAYTGATQSKPGQLEQAAGGTLFLDEVGEMSPTAQAKFLRVLQEREFQRLGGTRVLRSDARVIAATNRDLPRAIANNQFREDLYYRLHVFAISLPPLRDRRDDILPLSESFLAEIGRGLGCPPGALSSDARRVLLEYHWPGNVRELRNSLERAAILCDGGPIIAEHLALGVGAARPAPSGFASAVPAAAPAGMSDAPSSTPPAGLPDVEKAMIEQALQAARFNKSKAAQAIGLTRHQLYVRMRKYGLE